MRRHSILVTLALALAIVGLGMALAPDTPSAQQPPQKVVFALNWFAGGRPRGLLGGAGEGLLQAARPRRGMQNSKGSGDSIAKVDTGRADVGLADSAVVIALVGPRGEGEGGRHGLRQEPAEHLEPQGRADHQAQGPRGQDVARRRATASGRCSPPSPAPRDRPDQGDVGQHRARGQGRPRWPRSAWTRWPTTPPACRSTRRPWEGQRGHDAVGRPRLRHVQHVDHREREDDEGAGRRCCGRSSRRRTWAGAT